MRIREEAEILRDEIKEIYKNKLKKDIFYDNTYDWSFWGGCLGIKGDRSLLDLNLDFISDEGITEYRNWLLKQRMELKREGNYE